MPRGWLKGKLRANGGRCLHIERGMAQGFSEIWLLTADL
jgi:hypothetical protein